MQPGPLPEAPAPTAHVYVLASEWQDLRDTVKEARTFALEARESSRANHQTIMEVVKPAIDKVDLHEQTIQRGKGAIWVMGIIYGLATFAVGILAVAR